MFEKEIKFISDYVINKIKDLGSFFTYDELFDSGVNPAILKFISAELDYRIYEDRKKLLHQSAFDYSGSEIAKYFNLIAKEIKKSTKISFDEIKDLVNQAIAFNTDFIISPNETLRNLFFNKSEEIGIEGIKLKLNYIYYYPYIKDILNSYLIKKKIEKITSSRLMEILSEINKQLFVSNSEKIIGGAVDTIFDFYNIGNTGNKKLPVNIVGIYLEKMNSEKYSNRLKEKVPTDSKNKYDIDEIKSILFSFQLVEEVSKTISEEPVEEQEQEIVIVEQEEKVSEEKIVADSQKELDKPESKENVQEDSDEKEIEFDITEHDNLDALYNFNEEETETDVSKNENKKEEIKEEIKSSNDFELEEDKEGPVVEKKHKKEKPKKKSRNKDIFSYLSDKEIEKIVGNIFNDDRDEFAVSMEKISDSASYEEATEILKKIFIAYNVNPYLKEAITFTNAVSNYFEQG